MTVNPLKGSTEIIVWKCQPSWCPLSTLYAWQLALSLSLYPSLPLIFFLLRGADSPDTIIQLYCGADTVAAVLCKGFPHMVWGQSGVSRCGGGTEKCRYRQKGLVTSWYTIPHCVTWQVPQTVFTFPISQLHHWSRNEEERSHYTVFILQSLASCVYMRKHVLTLGGGPVSPLGCYLSLFSVHSLWYDTFRNMSVPLTSSYQES